MTILFKKTKELEARIDEYLDCVIQGALLFKQGLRYFLESRDEDFRKRASELEKMEHRGDALRRTIESTLYEHTLIPESRGDVLGLLESTDTVLNAMSETLIRFGVEKPEFTHDHFPLYFDLIDLTAQAVEAMNHAIRSYFRDLNGVRDQISKVQFFEKEADNIARKIKQQVFESQLDLCQKIHIRDFVDYIENITNLAEDVCDRLTIATIKRYL